MQFAVSIAGYGVTHAIVATEAALYARSEKAMAAEALPSWLCKDMLLQADRGYSFKLWQLASARFLRDGPPARERAPAPSRIGGARSGRSRSFSAARVGPKSA